MPDITWTRRFKLWREMRAAQLIQGRDQIQ
jgi:hypothetical protein